MKEIWRDIPNYEGYYQASNLGRIKSLWYGREKILKPCEDGQGYLQVFLCKGGKKSVYKIHKLIALTFIKNELNKPCINHKDENKQNNKIDNLEWCTHIYNTRYSQAKKVKQYDKEDKLIRKWDCMAEASLELNIDRSHISSCCQGKRKTAGGYIWRYENG